MGPFEPCHSPSATQKGRPRACGCAREKFGAKMRLTLPTECSGDTHHFFAADFFAFFGAGAAAAFFAIAEGG